MAEQAPRDTIREESPPSQMSADEKGHDEQAPKFLDGMYLKPYYNFCTRFNNDPI